MSKPCKAVVVGNDHYNTLNVIRALGKDNIEVYCIIHCETMKSFVAKSKYIHKCILITNEEEIKETLLNMRDTLFIDEKIPLISTSDRLAVAIDLNYAILSKFYYLPSVKGVEGQLVKEMSKDIQILHASEAGFDVPKSTCIDLSREFIQDSLSIDYFPCLIKPDESYRGSKNHFKVCRNHEELDVALKNLSKNLNSVIVQQFIPNDKVILIAGVRTINGENYIFGEIDKYKNSKNINNMGLNCIGRFYPVSELEDKCRKYVDSIDYRGCYSIDCIRSIRDNINEDEKNWFLEINLRSDGLLFFYTKSNINYPSIWVRSCYGEDCKVSRSSKTLFGMNEINYLKNYLSLSSIKDFVKTDTFSLFDIKDLKPFLYKFIYHGRS